MRSDLAAALQTIREIVDQDGLFELRMRQRGLLRPLGAAELSEGTLCYLLPIAALLSPRLRASSA